MSDATPAEPPITVVLVDDHEEIRELFTQVLLLDGRIEVVGTADSGRAAIDVVGRRKPDVVVIDFVLPDMSGATAIEMLLAESPDSKVITVSGLGAPGAYQAAANAGSAAWIRKSNAVKDLRLAIHQVHAGEHVSGDASEVPAVGDIVVHYQPVHRLSTGTVVGMEALVRWSHPNGSIVSPADFLPRAELAGMVGDFDRKVSEISARQLSEWQVRYPTDPPRWVSVNLSALDMRRPDLPYWIIGALETARVSANSFVVEITEEAITEDEDQTLRRLERLKEIGVLVALDDFIGASTSVSFMRRFPFDMLKIDHGLTAQLPHAKEAITVMRTVQELASRLNLVCIAEGVERENQIATMREFGCELGQGYLFSRPAPAAECETLLSEDAAGLARRE